jgi:soluble lytic murein transglycosylase-like protein
MVEMRQTKVRGFCVSGVLLSVLAMAAPAHADLIFFSTGRSLSVKSHHIDGDSLVLTLRTGGEIVCDRAGIVRIEPDEVPYPEPEAEAVPPGISVALTATADVPYGDLINRVAVEQGVDSRLVQAVIKVESAYRQHARSPKGAMGLMQLMPGTARQYAVANPYEAQSNIEGGVRYLKSLLDRFELKLALAAYNAGEAAVLRFGGIPPYPETQEYVKRVLLALGTPALVSLRKS